ncbi:NAD(P)/FAD-dependent oxidoreductase [Shimazuella kribbensis]|uniref:NAD(P)/FAD-dependent oxidoreductase n=1 Tax=Shimazuella kribbensis TaxID=139808 RepID=UPI00041F03A8|nr:NAD(P)/FAD-dependent oxidoreductase [Shimazuella kribbensis]
MIMDCAIIGGGPAGLNAALVLGRAKRNVILFDDNNPRNRVTKESHGFITRDGIHPMEFRKIAHQEISHYPSVEMQNVRITKVETDKYPAYFCLTQADGEKIYAKNIILATGLKENLPAINGINDFYGKSLFNCPYCDGWELRNKPLIVISEQQNVFHLTTMVWNWSQDLIVCTNGQQNLNRKQKEKLEQKGIQVQDQKIISLVGKDGQLERVIFENHEVQRMGGFISPRLIQASSFHELLGCEADDQGKIIKDDFGRTNIKGVYVAGDTITPSHLISSAAEGSRAAMGVNADLTEREFA